MDKKTFTDRSSLNITEKLKTKTTQLITIGNLLAVNEKGSIKHNINTTKVKRINQNREKKLKVRK